MTIKMGTTELTPEEALEALDTLNGRLDQRRQSGEVKLQPFQLFDADGHMCMNPPVLEMKEGENTGCIDITVNTEGALDTSVELELSKEDAYSIVMWICSMHGWKTPEQEVE